MERVNSWGREIKDKFSVSFKKDEDDLKLFLNEQPSPVEYLKVLARKDMMERKSNTVSMDHTPKEQPTITHTIITETSQQTNIEEPVINDEAKAQLLKILND